MLRTNIVNPELIRTDFKAGELLSAKDWNSIATEVNRLWETRALFPLHLVKGDNWCLTLDPAYLEAFLKSLPGGPVDPSALTMIELPACIDGVDGTIWMPAVPA